MSSSSRLSPACSLTVVAILAWLPRVSAQSTPPQVAHHLPQLASVFPQGSQPGVSSKVKVLGEFLDQAKQVLFLDPAIQGKVLTSQPSWAELELRVDPNAGYGPHFFRVVTHRGASDLLLFRVGDLPHHVESEPNDSFDTAEEVRLPATLNGKIDTQTEVDFFRFQAEKGENWVFDLRASRNGNGLDAGLVLLDSERRELEYSEDVVNWDPLFDHTFQQSGTYYVVVQSSHGQFLDAGKYVDPGFGYQLEIRRSPHLIAISPLAFQPGGSARATIVGKGRFSKDSKVWFDEPSFAGEVVEVSEEKAELLIQVPAQARPGEHRLALLTPGGRSSTLAFRVDSTPAHIGVDWLRPPASVSRIARYPQPERFLFEAKAGQSLVFEVHAWRIGSPADMHLRLLDSTGKELAKNDDASFPGASYNKDPQILHKFEVDGEYELEVRSMTAVDDDLSPYQLVVRPFQPRVELMLETDHPYVFAGGSGQLKISAIRHEGAEGAIPILVKGLPEGIRPVSAEIAKGKDEVEITFQAEGHLKPGSSFQIQIVSSPDQEPAWKFVTLPRYGGPETALERMEQVTLAVAEKPCYSLESSLDSVSLARGGFAELPVLIRRSESFDQDIELAVDNLPPGVSAERAVASLEATEIKVRLHASREAQPGRSDHVAVLGKSAGGALQAAPRISLVVE
jgi:hypothetical protein